VRKGYPDERTLRQLITALDIEDPPVFDEEVEQALYLPSQSNQNIEEAGEIEEAGNQLINEHRQRQQEQVHQGFSKGYQGLPSSEATPEVEDIRSEAKRLESTPDLGHQESEENRAEEYQPNMSIPRGWQPIGEDQEAPN
jgi:hypothetical protein